MRGSLPSRAAAFLVAPILAVTMLHLTPAVATTPCPNTNAFSGISNLSLWLRADCVNGVDDDPADDTALTTWVDVSGNGNNATATGTPVFQSDSANLINSNPVVYFGGSATFRGIDIRATTRPNLSIIAVYKARGNGNREGIWGVDDGGWDRFFLARWSGNDGLQSVGNSIGVSSTGVIGATNMVATVMQYNVSNGTKVYRNGALSVTTTDNANLTGAYTTVYIGSGGSGLNLTGDIAELIIFDQALSTSDLATVNGYLNTKYNLGIAAENLPVVVTAPTFNTFRLSGSVLDAVYRTAINIEVNVNQNSKVTFLANGKNITGCVSKPTTGSGSSYSATCSWRPSNKGSVVLSARAVGVSGGLRSSPESSLNIKVSNRLTKR